MIEAEVSDKASAIKRAKHSHEDKAIEVEKEGKPDPNPRMKYRIVRLEEVNPSPEIAEVCKSLERSCPHKRLVSELNSPVRRLATFGSIR